MWTCKKELLDLSPILALTLSKILLKDAKIQDICLKNGEYLVWKWYLWKNDEIG